MGQRRLYSDLTKNDIDVLGIVVRFAVGQEIFFFPKCPARLWAQLTSYLTSFGGQYSAGTVAWRLS